MNEETKHNIWLFSSVAILVFGFILYLYGTGVMEWVAWFISVIGGIGVGYLHGYEEGFRGNVY